MLSGGTWIASAYLQPRIGSDIALFKGLARAVLEAGEEDPEFIALHTRDFEAFRDDVMATSWETITTLTGVSQTEIEKVAALYSRAQRVVFAWGMGMTHHLHGVDNIECLTGLALLRGMIGKRYAGLLPLRGHSNVQGIGTIGVKPVLPAEIFERLEQELGVSLPRSPGVDTMAGMQAAAAGNIDTAVMMGGNLYGANPDAAWAEQALDRIGFKLFMTTTLNRGHVCGVAAGESLVLPVTARDEERQATTQESMFNYVRLSDGGITRLDGVRPEVDILVDIGRRLLPECPVDLEAFRSHRTIREAIARTVPGMEALADIDVARQEFHVRGRLLHTPEFRTGDGRARFRTVPLPAPRSAAANGHPAFMLTTMRSEGQFNTIIYEREDSYRQTADRWSVLMSESDIDRLGISAGDRITLCSGHGRMAGVQVYPFDLPAGDLMAYFPEANILTGTAVDPRSHTPAFKATPVWVER